MIPHIQNAPQTLVKYPDSDGNPMADDTKQFRWIVTIEQNLECIFANDPNVFVAGDLLWYPVEGCNTIRQAPDILVVFGRPKGDRGSYQQWKEADTAPHVVFEILSPGNTQTEMNRKLLFYERYGVEEYYLYDPDKNDLSDWLRSTNGQRLDIIDPIEQWVSPRLQIRFALSQNKLKLYQIDGTPFLTYVAIANQLEQATEELAQDRQRADRLAEKLRQAGIDPEGI
jgi:Uma2 family endonuclease